ncbi:MAG TPA: hypothetical protein VF571_00925 [Pyrinomonadaceae bacterium]|jgi:hypothetical protein
MKIKFLIAGIFAIAAFTMVVAIFSTYKVESQSITKSTKQTERKDLPVVDLSTVEMQEHEYSFRQKRSKRYDSEGGNLDKSKLVFTGNSLAEIYDLPANDIRIDALPVYQSNAIIIGTVTDRKAFLSNDKTAVYSEFAIEIEQVLKGEENSLLHSQSTVTIQRRGGAVRLPSGKILRRGAITEFMPLSDKKYLFFLKYYGDSESFEIITGYELRDGRVFPLDGQNLSEGKRKNVRFTAYEGKTQEEFLRLIQNELAEQAGGENE